MKQHRAKNKGLLNWNNQHERKFATRIYWAAYRYDLKKQTGGLAFAAQKFNIEIEQANNLYMGFLASLNENINN